MRFNEAILHTIDIAPCPIYSFFFRRSPFLIEPGILKKELGSIGIIGLA
jgi:hypothetical protein